MLLQKVSPRWLLALGNVSVEILKEKEREGGEISESLGTRRMI